MTLIFGVSQSIKNKRTLGQKDCTIGERRRYVNAQAFSYLYKVKVATLEEKRRAKSKDEKAKNKIWQDKSIEGSDILL